MNRRQMLLATSSLLCAVPPALLAQALPPALTGQTLDGKPYDLKQDKGKVVLVFFWSTNCAVCRDKMPELRANYEAWREKAFQIVAVCTDKSLDDVRAYERALSGVVPTSQRFPWVWRGAAGHHDNFGPVAQTPSTVLLDRKGMVVKQWRGRIAPELWDDIAELVLA